MLFVLSLMGLTQDVPLVVETHTLTFDTILCSPQGSTSQTRCLIMNGPGGSVTLLLQNGIVVGCIMRLEGSGTDVVCPRLFGE
jgi:hypothetical protein